MLYRPSFRRVTLLLLTTIASLQSASAVETFANYNATTGTYVAPDSSVYGAAYVGQFGGATAVYIGNGYALSVGHAAGPSTFILGGTTYTVSDGMNFFNGPAGGTTDLYLFKISSLTKPLPNLPDLTLAQDPPDTSGNTSVTMIGYGGGQGETYGVTPVGDQDTPVYVNGFLSEDFLAYPMSATQSYGLLVGGDSGGAGFITNPTTGVDELAGLGEATAGNSFSYFVQLSVDDPSYKDGKETYAQEISTIAGLASPEPSTWALLLGGIGALAFYYRRRIA